MSVYSIISFIKVANKQLHMKASNQMCLSGLKAGKGFITELLHIPTMSESDIVSKQRGSRDTHRLFFAAGTVTHF